MKQISIVLALLTIVIATANAQTNNTLSTLQRFRADYTASMLKGDVSFMSYADTAIRLMPEFYKTVMPRPNVAQYYEAFHARFDVTAFSRKESEVLDMGSRVAEWGLFTMTLVHRKTNKRYELPGKYMDIWIKEPSGKLSIVSQAWNYNQSIDFADQLKFSGISTTNVALGAHTPVVDHISFELAGLNELMESIIIQHDARLWKMFYADDGNFMYSNNPLYQGRQALDAFLDEHTKGLVTFEKLDIRNDHIVDLGTYVIEYASHTAFVRGENWSGVGTGKDIRIWRRERDCSLKIFRHIGMYD